MDCRKCLVLAAGLLLSDAGCITQKQNALSEKTTTTVWTPLSLFQKEAKRTPNVELCLKGGESLEKEALSPTLNSLAKEESLQRSRQAYQQALDLDRNNLQAMLGLARVHTALREFDKAQATNEKAAKLHPDSALAWYELGECHFWQKHFDKAADAFRKALETDPEERTCAKKLSVSLALAGHEQESLKVLTKLYGEAAKAHYEYALIHLKLLNQPEKAVQHLYIALQRDPMYGPAREMLTRLNQDAAAPETHTANIGFRAE